MSTAERPKVGRPVSNTPEQLLERLIQSAVDILSEQAADADLSVAQLAQRAKVSKKTVYTVVASKEELIAHVIRHGAQVATTMLDMPVANAAGAREVLASFLKDWIRFACGPQAVGIYVMAIRERSRYPAIGAAYYRSRNEHGLQQLAAWLRRMHDKQFCPAEDAVMTADLVLTMASAERQRVLALGMDAPFTAEQEARRIDAILAFVFRAHAGPDRAAAGRFSDEAA
jgi:AcrR family transcriptional regulator